jgi:hypothetical protein
LNSSTLVHEPARTDLLSTFGNKHRKIFIPQLQLPQPIIKDAAAIGAGCRVSIGRSRLLWRCVHLHADKHMRACFEAPGWPASQGFQLNPSSVSQRNGCRSLQANAHSAPCGQVAAADIQATPQRLICRS